MEVGVFFSVFAPLSGFVTHLLLDELAANRFLVFWLKVHILSALYCSYWLFFVGYYSVLMWSCHSISVSAATLVPALSYIKRLCAFSALYISETILFLQEITNLFFRPSTLRLILVIYFRRLIQIRCRIIRHTQSSSNFLFVSF